MSWQDLVLAGGGFILTVGLVPMFRAAEPPPLRTSVTLLVVLSSYVVTLASLELWVAATGTALQATLWGLLAVQRWKSIRRSAVWRGAEAAASAGDFEGPGRGEDAATVAGRRHAGK